MIDIVEANRRARDLLWAINSQEVTRIEAKKVYAKVGSRKTSTSKKKKTDTDTHPIQ
jgi:hypothetical protein